MNKSEWKKQKINKLWLINARMSAECIVFNQKQLFRFRNESDLHFLWIDATNDEEKERKKKSAFEYRLCHARWVSTFEREKPNEIQNWLEIISVKWIVFFFFLHFLYDWKYRHINVQSSVCSARQYDYLSIYKQ